MTNYYVQMFEWLMRREFGSVEAYIDDERDTDALDRFEFWLAFYQLLAMEAKR